MLLGRGSLCYHKRIIVMSVGLYHIFTENEFYKKVSDFIFQGLCKEEHKCGYGKHYLRPLEPIVV